MGKAQCSRELEQPRLGALRPEATVLIFLQHEVHYRQHLKRNVIQGEKVKLVFTSNIAEAKEEQLHSHITGNFILDLAP